jgi:hypothetical protein
VAYVAQCIVVEARLYNPMNYTQQIPAEIGSKVHGNVTRKYANAQTMILQDFRTKVPCTRQYPPKWKIENKWYCSFQIVRECNEAPTQLNLTYDHSLPQHEGHLRRDQRRDPDSHLAPREPAVETAGTMPGGHCSCISVYGSVQLPESSDFGQTPGSDYHGEGCLCVCHDNYSFLCALRVDVVLPKRAHGALHENKLHLQRDPKDDRIAERERIRVVADWRAFGPPRTISSSFLRQW